MFKLEGKQLVIAISTARSFYIESMNNHVDILTRPDALLL